MHFWTLSPAFNASGLRGQVARPENAPQVRPALIKLLKDPSPPVRVVGVKALAAMSTEGDDEATDELPRRRTSTAVAPTPATHAIFAHLKAGECMRHSM